jgi:hypothetical protein
MLLYRKEDAQKPMATSQNPLTGQMSGTVANFVTSTRAKQNVIRSKAFKPRNANTESQQLQRASFKLIVDENQSWGGIINQGFPELAEGQTPATLFMAINLPNAIDKSGAVPAVDYTKLLVASGSLPQVTVTGATFVAGGINISFKTNVRIPAINETDEVIAIAKTSEGEILMDTKVRGAEVVGSILIDYPGIKAADVKCCYLFVRSADGSKASKSTWVPLS